MSVYSSKLFYLKSPVVLWVDLNEGEGQIIILLKKLTHFVPK